VVGAVRQTVQAFGAEAIPPVLGGVTGDAQRGGDGGATLPRRRTQDDSCQQGRLLTARARPDPALQFITLGSGEVKLWCMASHRVRSWEERPPIQQAYTRNSFRSNLKWMDY
jgi:hypothetical protein